MFYSCYREGGQINQNVNNCKGSAMFLPKLWSEIWPLIMDHHTITLLVMTECHSDRNTTPRQYTQTLILNWFPRHDTNKPFYYTQSPELQAETGMFHLSPSSILRNGAQAHKAVTWPFSFNQRESYLSVHYTCLVERSATAIHTYTHTYVQRRRTPGRRAPHSEKKPHSWWAIKRITTHVSLTL